jgi:hypothetical protein
MFDVYNELQIEFVIVGLLVPVSFATLAYLLWYMIKFRYFRFYLRMSLGMFLMVLTYIFGFLRIYHRIPSHRYDIQDFWQILESQVFENIWQLRVLPTLLYTWQYHDVVQRVKPESKLKYWTRWSCCALLTITLLLLNLTQDTMTALSGYYETLAHLDYKKSNRFGDLSVTF